MSFTSDDDESCIIWKHVYMKNKNKGTSYLAFLFENENANYLLILSLRLDSSHDYTLALMRSDGRSDWLTLLSLMKTLSAHRMAVDKIKH